MQDEAKTGAERGMSVRFMEALGATDIEPLNPQDEGLPWINRAIAVYQVSLLQQPSLLWKALILRPHSALQYPHTCLRDHFCKNSK